MLVKFRFNSCVFEYQRLPPSITPISFLQFIAHTKIALIERNSFVCGRGCHRQSCAAAEKKPNLESCHLGVIRENYIFGRMINIQQRRGKKGHINHKMKLKQGFFCPVIKLGLCIFIRTISNQVSVVGRFTYLRCFAYFLLSIIICVMAHKKKCCQNVEEKKVNISIILKLSTRHGNRMSND